MQVDAPGLTIVQPGKVPRPVDQYDAPMLLAGNPGRRFHVMIKPAGSACNLNCAYCFYLSKATLPDGPGTGLMSDGVLETLISQYTEGVTASEVVFSWQGGEPTIRGLEFFRKVVALQNKYRRKFQRIENDLQTNGTLLNEDWCEFLKANRFLVGLSIDGPREIHDAYRVTKGAGPTFDKVFQAAKLLSRYKVPFNTLSCIHRLNARRPLDVYRFLRNDVGSTYIQFIPIVEFNEFERVSPYRFAIRETESLPARSTEGAPRSLPGNSDSFVTGWSVDPNDWGYFLCKTFDEWSHNDVGKVFVNQFETLASQHLGLGSQICVYSEVCGKGVAVEHDGSVYSCDHYVYPEHRLGNIWGASLANMVFSREQVRFGFAKNESLPRFCRECPYLSDCWGECPKNRFLSTPDGERGLNYLCRGFRTFFAHALPEVERICTRLRAEGIHQLRRL